ncbi:MAG: RNA-binding S4 domain-containing protein [Actinobacteria bacterium]|nr:RNA-binding S4 domain-containing protein [Actinomycetota bacterium]
MIDVFVRGPLTLGALLKVAGIAGSGGEAKAMVQGGRIRLNGAEERRRAHLVRPGDVVAIDDQEYRVCTSPR